MRKVAPVAALITLVQLATAGALPAQQHTRFTRADTLRGSDGPGRAWWDATFYDLHVRVNPADSSITGRNGITYRVLHPANEMQIDLQLPMEVDSMVQDGRRVEYRRDGNAFFARLVAPQKAGESKTITVFYHGRPKVAMRAPWDGGFVWARDSLGNPWVATANEGLGASVWWPMKDLNADEPDSQRVAITVPDPMMNVSNGRLRGTTRNPDGTTSYEWFVVNPINGYNVAVNAGSYAHFSDSFDGEKGELTLDFYPLAYHLDTARSQFRQVKSMLACFEHWFGPYPWYEDGYKLVETPHLGMEHQSAVAYGNHYLNGYRGRDLSGTGLGLKWDFIIVHESAHEWWGNNITDKDAADMWIHESFANYAEGIYEECRAGKESGARYILGSRRNIQNDAPIVGHFGVNSEGSGDMYYKGGNMLHTIRQVIDDDERWRGILRGLNATFYHQTVSGEQVRNYIGEHAGVDLSRVFEQYLNTTKIPVLEYRIAGNELSYHWADVVPGFAMPVKVWLSDGESRRLEPTESWQSLALPAGAAGAPRVDENFYVFSKDVSGR